MANPIELLKMKERLKIFREEHPRVSAFFHSIKEDGLEPGAILELKVILTDGREKVANIRLTENDIETLKMLENIKHK